MPDKYCEHCGIWIAPFDPHKVEMGEVVYHSACLKEKLEQLVPYQVRVETEPQQLTLFVQ